MQIEFGLVVSLDPATRRFLEQLMSPFAESIADLKQHVADATSRVQTDVSGLKAKVDALSAQIAAGGLTEEDKAAIAELRTMTDAIDPTSPAVLPTPPPPV